jgi:hypothetical protein
LAGQSSTDTLLCDRGEPLLSPYERHALPADVAKSACRKKHTSRR